MTPNINTEFKLFINNQIKLMNSLLHTEKTRNKTQTDDSSSAPVLLELDGALKVNLKRLIDKIEGKSAQTLKSAIETQDKLLQKLTNVIKKI